MQQYDYIFAGAGLSSLMTVYEMIQSGLFSEQKLLLIDSDAKKANDRTWSFWEKSTGSYDDILVKNYHIALFKNQDYSRDLALEPYLYKTIRGIDFYKKVFDLINLQPNIEFANATITTINEANNGVEVHTNAGVFTAKKVFNSLYNPNLVTAQTKFPLVQQHFIGWFIKSKEAVFAPETATFMDFSVEQRGNTRFMYVLPTSKTEALVEYTLFSPTLLKKEEYETEIEHYLQNLGISEYEITEKEQGNIPMTCYPFWKHNTQNILNIGSAGGWTKGSTGYTFKNTIRKSKQLTQFLQHQSDFRKFHKKTKFWVYDLLLIDILFTKNYMGGIIFAAMFKNTKPDLIFKFLDEETTFWEDLKIIWQCPSLPFIKAIFKRIF